MTLLLLAACFLQQHVENERPRFSLKLPVGYTPAKEELPLNRFYVKETRTDQTVRLVATVSILSGETEEGDIARRREELAKEMSDNLPDRGPVRSLVRRMPWKGHSIEILELRFSKGGNDLIAAMAFIPTLSQTVRIEVLGPEKLEGDVHSDLSDIVRSCEAMPSWLLPEHLRYMRLAPLPAMISMAGVPVYILAWLVFFRRKPRRLVGYRIAWMFLMGGLMLLPPLLWSAYLKDAPVPPPGVCRWPLPLFLAAPWLMLATARLAALAFGPKESPVPEPPPAP